MAGPPGALLAPTCTYPTCLHPDSSSENSISCTPSNHAPPPPTVQGRGSKGQVNE